MKFFIGLMFYSLFLLGSVIPSPYFSPASDSKAPMVVYYLPLSGSSFEELIAGEYGDGLILFASNNSPQVYQFAVRLTKQMSMQFSRAEIFQLPVDISAGDQSRLINEILNLTPVIIIENLDGWWVKNGQPSYNLNIQIRGPISAMWGAGEKQTSIRESWLFEVDPDQPTVQILVRDRDHDGIPDWELRSLLPALPGRADIRSNFAASKCDSPLAIDPGFFPAWPYFSIGGGYEQSPGSFRPPIVVNLDTGLITHFSELVSVRNQNCAYSFYTINQLISGVFNQTNFEAPYAIYDLSREGAGYPNLILRAEHYPAGDRWFRQSTSDFETVRYSWRNTIGDGHWDYKIEVAGFHPYDDKTPIAGGQLMVDAPAYEEFPHWVVSRSWPVATYINTNIYTESSSEGIYAWSPRELSDEYLRGEVDSPKSTAFSNIKPGWHGEYRYTKNLPPLLYASPVDNNLHLLAAEGGMINLGNGLVLREENLDQDSYIDTWLLEENECIKRSADYNDCRIKIKAALYDLGKHLVYSSEDEVVILPAEPSKEIFRLLPPTDHRTWVHFKEKVASLRENKKDPYDLRSWIDDFSNHNTRIIGASLSEVSISPDGYQFVFELHPGCQATPGNRILPSDCLAPGSYLLEYDGQFHLEPNSAALASLEIISPPHDSVLWNPGTARVVVTNEGERWIRDTVLTVTTIQGDQTQEVEEHLAEIKDNQQKQVFVSCQLLQVDNCKIQAVLKSRQGKEIAEADQEIAYPNDGLYAIGFLRGIQEIRGSFPTIGLVVSLLAFFYWTVTKLLNTI